LSIVIGGQIVLNRLSNLAVGNPIQIGKA
jgi:hypothetical protein